MSGVNKVILIGHLGRDPESKSFQNGGKVVNFRIATSESWKDKATGERRERTEWHSIVVFNEVLQRVAEQYLRKGSKVYVEGQLQTRKWQDSAGADRYSTEVVLNVFGGAIVLLDRREADPGRNDFSGHQHEGRYAGPTDAGEAAKPPPSGSPAFADDLDDDVPF